MNLYLIYTSLHVDKSSRKSVLCQKFQAPQKTQKET